MKTTMVFLAALLLICSGAIAQQEQASTNEVIFVSAEKAAFEEVIPGVSRSVLWGDPQTGAYGGFTRFLPGFDAGMHSHTNDVWLVVLDGAYIYRDDAGEKRVGPREFIRIPAGKRHWSGGDAQEGALFYEEAAGKFDLVPADEAPASSQ